MMPEFLQIFAEHKHIGNLGYYTPPPDNFSDALALKSSPVDDEAILSDVSFTEKWRNGLHKSRFERENKPLHPDALCRATGLFDLLYILFGRDETY